MALNKLYYVYGLDTACFYNNEENNIEKKIIKARHLKKLIKNRKEKNKEIKKKTKNQISFLNEYINKYKQLLKEKLHDNINITRTVRLDKILNKEGQPSLKRRVSIFDSNLTRCFGLKEREFNEEILIVKVYFFDVAKSIVKNGFSMNGYNYKFFSASAGQIRTKKLVAVREDLLNQHWDTLSAGLTIDKINSTKIDQLINEDTGEIIDVYGMNINKFLAYLALCNSATDLWEGFDIDKCIIVNDFENEILGDVDFIDEKTYKIERKNMNISITQTDGCGMILPSVSDRNFMVRLPWVKGLLAKFNFVEFIKNTKKSSSIVTDIYGNKHDIIKEDIQIIFTKSQFKMWKFYKNWEEYKENFKKYNCTAGKCNVEEDKFPDAVINYQMIQTLSDMTDEEITSLASVNNKDIIKLTSDMKTMLKVFKAVSWNKNKTGFQKCLEKYPELLSDTYTRQTLKELKNKLEKDLWSARFDIGAKYTFVIPDLYAFCECLFCGIKNPQGLLKNGEVCCKLFDDNIKLDCLRSPHLYIEHPIRINKTNIKWFDTNAIYISCKDLISKIVQCDWDGDKLLVVGNQTFVSIAERNMKNVVPLFYNMSKAKAEKLTPDSLFEGLLLAYNGGNIGVPSNDITKIWNSGEITQEQLDVIKWLCLEVNFTIDYAKTLYKPKRPSWANDIIIQYTKNKTPYFFQFAKDKKINQVEKISECVVDRISKIYPKKNVKYNFTKNNIGKFNYQVLMNNPNIEFREDIVNEYKKIVGKLNFGNLNGEKNNGYIAVFDDAKNKILALDSSLSINNVVDIIIIDLFKNRHTPLKKAFWMLFEDIVYKNLCFNLKDNYIQCEKCHTRFFKKGKEKNCPNCREYKPIENKIIICQDCGKEVVIDSKDNETIRCKECYKKHRTEYYKLKKREQRNKIN